MLNEDLFTLLYRCLNVSKVRCDALTAVALQIIHKLMGDSTIFSKFMSDDILFRVMSVPCYLTSSYYAMKIMVKVFESCQEDILQDDKYILKLMTDYTLRSTTNFVDQSGMDAIHCFFGYLPLSDDIQLDVLPKITREFHQLEFYKASHNELNNNIKENYRLLKKNFSQITTFLECVILYLARYIIHQNPDLFHSQDIVKNPVNNKQFCDEIINILEASGYIQMPNQVISNQIDRTLFEILFLVLRSIYRAKPKDNIQRIYELISRTLNMCIIIKDVRDLFVENFECHPKYPHNIKNVMSTLFLIFDDYFMDDCWIQFSPYSVINNLLKRCCTSFESYQICVGKSKHEKSETWSEKREVLIPDSNTIIDELMANSFLLYALRSFDEMVKLIIPNDCIMYLIKCLIILCECRRVSDILSQDLIVFNKSFKNYMKEIRQHESGKYQRKQILKLAEILTEKIDNIKHKPLEFFEKDSPESKKRKFDQGPEHISSDDEASSQILLEKTITSFVEEHQPIEIDATISYDQNQESSRDTASFELRIKSEENIQKRKDLYSKKFQSIKEFCFKGTRIKRVLKILKDDSILIPNENVLNLFYGNRCFPKFNFEFEKTNHIVDSFNGDLVMSCAKLSGQTKCYMWKYDGVHDDNLHVDPCVTIENICQTQFSYDDKKIIGINSNFDVDVIDIETCVKNLELKNPNRKYYFEGNYPQYNSNNTLILSNGELYSPSGGKLIHVFDRLEYIQTGIFSVSGNEVIYGQEQVFFNQQKWDLRTLKILKQIPQLEYCFLRRTHNEDIYLGYEYGYAERCCEDPYVSSHMIRGHSGFDLFKLIDPLTFDTFYELDTTEFLQKIKQMEPIDISRDGSKIAALSYCSYDGKTFMFTVFGEGKKQKIQIDIA
ncbi:Protein VPRBP [Thelohanellus kitauei]|uniref:Protein VPRBP n=1 Tax=Thelohanellus kitauei TaxID=669202 RepID=A0A0C2ICK6_THEKT|nr:Protein VPRBP [Thelohanellus kitauei]